MITIAELIKRGANFLKKGDGSERRRDAEAIIAFHLQLKRLDLYLYFDRPVEEKELGTIRDSFRRRASGEPLDYIFGKKFFYNLELNISKDVLIPRQETELLLDKIVQKLKTQDLQGKNAWDLCSGSGCLGLGLKKQFPALSVTLSDLSEAALKLAGENAQRNQLDVQIVQGDLLQPFQGKKADFILCNPPYVSHADYSALCEQVQGFEPKMALVAGPTGLEFYQGLAEQLPCFLHPGAQLFFEIGTGQGNQVKSFFQATHWRDVNIEKDYAGHERFFTAIFLEIQ